MLPGTRSSSRVRGALRLPVGSVGRRMAGAGPAVVGAWLSRATRSPQWGLPEKAGLEAVTGTIGARRAWTVSMISALSMPCR